MTQGEAVETESTNVGSEVGHNGVLSPDEGPRAETVTAVGRVFAEILGISAVPYTESFFDLGIDSLSVTLVCARLEKATGVRIRFSQLFRTPTVAKLAAWIDTTRDELSGGPTVTARPLGSTLVAITPRMAQTIPMGITMHMVWWLEGEIDDAALEMAASDLHRRHQALHARYLTGPDLGLAEVPADPGQADFRRLPQEDSDSGACDAILRTLDEPLPLSEGRVWRCVIVRSRQSGRTMFGIGMDHAAGDGRSAEVMMSDLATAYSARTAGSAPQWPGRVASLAEMAADYRHQLEAQDADGQRRYWLDELHGLPACHLPGRKDVTKVSGPAVARSFTLRKTQLRIWEDYARANGMSASVGVGAAYVQAIIREGGWDFALMVGLANWAGEIINRTVTNRVGNIFLRPNGPSQSGSHLLSRMSDSYHRAMAARDVLIDPHEYENIFGSEGSDGMILFRNMPHMVYNTRPKLTLGNATGVTPPEFDTWDECRRELMLEVIQVPEGLQMHLIVRTDLYEASLADRLSQHIIDIINDGPERLEAETAR
jgi:acyl carrier protein